MKKMILCMALWIAAIPVRSQNQLPSDEDYVTIQNGHLFHRGERMRFWGAVGNFPGKTHTANEKVVQRLKDLGFNLVRFWREPAGDGTYQKGDGSRNDLVDHFLWTCQQNGIKIWYAALNNIEKALPRDVTVIDDPSTAEKWSDAIGAKGKNVRNHLARIWDPRLEKLGVERMKNIAGHTSLYTGLRYADDPNIIIWELSNEEWWFWRVKSRLAEVPPFFLQELTRDWNAFLHEKYPTRLAIERAWLGLLPFESYEKKDIRLLPLRNTQVDWQGKVLGVNIQQGVKQQYGVNDFNRQRGGDVIEFLLQKWLGHKQREAEALKAFGKSIRLGTLLWDTGIGSEIQAQFLHQQADAVAHCTYLNGFHHDPGHKRYPWYSGLEELPRMAWDQPWLEQNKIEGKPFFVYETQIHNPAKYRAEYPMRVAALGAVQDWDVVVWHYFGQVPEDTLRTPYLHAMDYTVAGKNHPQGLHFQYDEVQQSAMVAAGAIFRQGLLQPATTPTRFVFGKNDLLDPQTLENGGYYHQVMDRFSPTTFRYGSRIHIDTARASGEILGPSYRGRVYEVNPITPTPQVTYDWQKGHLTFDAPGVAMYTGFLGQYGQERVGFKNGVVFDNVEIYNPPGMPYPVSADEKYVSISCTSTDGTRLEDAQEILLSAVSTSFNSGFKLDPSKLKREFAWTFKENTGATVDVGKLPVQVSRVGVTVETPSWTGYYYEMLDFHLRPLAQGKIQGKQLHIPGDQEIFLVRVVKNPALLKKDFTKRVKNDE